MSTCGRPRDPCGRARLLTTDPYKVKHELLRLERFILALVIHPHRVVDRCEVDRVRGFGVLLFGHVDHDERGVATPNDSARQHGVPVCVLLRAPPAAPAPCSPNRLFSLNIVPKSSSNCQKASMHFSAVIGSPSASSRWHTSSDASLAQLRPPCPSKIAKAERRERRRT
eukprot:6695430-Prymnesium_polylepis.2